VYLPVAVKGLRVIQQPNTNPLLYQWQPNSYSVHDYLILCTVSNHTNTPPNSCLWMWVAQRANAWTHSAILHIWVPVVWTQCLVSWHGLNLKGWILRSLNLHIWDFSILVKHSCAYQNQSSRSSKHITFLS
jgi:hypothetical protein